MTANPLSTIPPIGPTTGMTSAPAAARFKTVDPVRLLQQNFQYLILATVLGGILGAGAWVAARKYRPQYASEATLVAFGIVNDAKSTTVGETQSGQLAEVETFIQNQMAVLTSEGMLREAIQWPIVQRSDWYASFGGDVRLAAKALEEDHLRVGFQRDSTQFNLTMTMGNVKDAQDVLDSLITVYLKHRDQSLQDGTAQLRGVQQGELERAEQKMADLKRQMSNFITQNDLATVELQHSEAAIAYETLNRQKVTMGMELQALMASASGMIQAQEEDPNRPMTESEEQQLRLFPSVAQREEQIRQINELIRTSLEMDIMPEHRSMRQLRKQIASVQQELDGLMVTELRKLRGAQVAQALQMKEGILAQMEKIETDTQQAHAAMKTLTNKLQQWEAMQEDMEMARIKQAESLTSLADLRMMTKRRDASRVMRHKAPSEAELVAPMWYVWIPGITLLTVGLTAGLIFLRELTDQRVKSPADVKMLSDATLLGLLPSAAEDRSAPDNVDGIVQSAPTGLMAESYRQVRTAVLSRMDRRGYKTLVMVGAQPQAGTSSVAQNLAASLAYNGRNVLIVDANFRRPAQHNLAGLRNNDQGLVDVLRDDVDASEVIHRDAELSLSVMPTGHGGDAPPELFEGSAFRSLLGRLESEYDLVIIDAPPALLTSESQLLAKHVDAIAVVVRAGVDQRGMVERMLRKLDGQRADVLGVILNGVRSSAGGYFRKSYEDFYNYSQDNGSAKSSNGRAGKKAAKKSKKSDRITGDIDDIAEVTLVEDDSRDS